MLQMYRVLGLFALLSVAALGCGQAGPPLATVTGTVTFENKPVEGGSIEFVPASGGRPSMAITDAEGKYQVYYLHNVPGAVLGRHKVRFQMGAAAADVAEEDQFSPPAAKQDVPENLTLNPAEVEVADGTNEFNFELTST